MVDVDGLTNTSQYQMEEEDVQYARERVVPRFDFPFFLRPVYVLLEILMKLLAPPPAGRQNETRLSPDHVFSLNLRISLLS